MALTHTITRRVAAGSRTLEKVTTKTAGAGPSLSESIPDSSTDLQIPFSVDVSQVKSCWIQATGGNLTVKTNSSSTPADTLALVDGVPQLWVEGDLATFFLTTDVTDLFVTNSSGAASTLDIEILYDPTP